MDSGPDDESSSAVSPSGVPPEGPASGWPACPGSSRVLGRVLSVGIWIFAPQKGQIPFRPAWNSLTFSLWPFGQ